MIDPTPLWDFDDPAASGERFLDAAEAATEPDRTAWLTQYARALGLQQQYDAAHRVLDQLSPTDRGVAALVDLERGRVLRSSGKPDEARLLFESAARLASQARAEALHVDALHMLALVAPPEAQVEAHQRALAVARAATDQRARDWDASLLNNLGMTYAEADDFASALPVFEEALAARQRIGDDGRTRVARWMVGWALRKLGRADEALAVQRALKADLEAVGAKDPYVDEELALLESS